MSEEGDEDELLPAGRVSLDGEATRMNEEPKGVAGGWSASFSDHGLFTVILLIRGWCLYYQSY